MGLLDRFKKEPGPDALTWEAVARLRVLPGVTSAEAVDADTVAVGWAGHGGTTSLSLADIRESWTKASGFARIELMDELVAGIAPPSAAAEPPPPVEPGAATAPEAPPAPTAPPAGTPAPPDDDLWPGVRDRLRVVVGPQGQHPGAVAWPVAGVLEARAVLGGPGALPVDHDDARSWGATDDDVRAAALGNLTHVDPGLDPIGDGQPAWVPTRPADHPPAWLAAPDRLLAACGLDRAVVLAPTPTELVVVDPSADALLTAILTSTKSIVAGESRILWPGPLLATADGLAPWAPEPGHPCAALVAELTPGA